MAKRKQHDEAEAAPEPEAPKEPAVDHGPTSHAGIPWVPKVGHGFTK